MAIARAYPYAGAFFGVAVLGVALAYAAARLLTLLAAPLFALSSDMPLGAYPFLFDPTMPRAAGLAVGIGLAGGAVWLLHWRWLRRLASPNARALYLRLVMLAAALVWTSHVHGLFHALLDASDAEARWIAVSLASQLLRWEFEASTLTGPEPSVASLAFLIVAGALWVWHRRAADADPELLASDRAVLAGELYRYAIAAVGLLWALTGAKYVVEGLWLVLVGEAERGSELLLDAAPDLATGALLLAIHLVWLRRPSSAAGTRSGPAAGFLYAGSGLAAIYAIPCGAAALAWGLGTLVGHEKIAEYGPAGVSHPISTTLAIGLAGMWFRRHIFALQRAGLTAAQETVRRVHDLWVSFVLLTMLLCAGALGLLWVGVHALTGTIDLGYSGMDREALIVAVGALAVGVPLWLRWWRPAAVVSTPAGRIYLRLMVALGALAAAAALAIALARMAGVTPLGAETLPLAVYLGRAGTGAIVAAAVAAYHWRLLRRP